MHLLSTKAQPALRRVLDAFGKLAFEFETERHDRAFATPDWRASFLEGPRNVIKHYRHVLATQRMAPAERQALLDHIARIEREIRAMEAPQVATA
jgi:hypothetical protein